MADPGMFSKLAMLPDTAFAAMAAVPKVETSDRTRSFPSWKMLFSSFVLAAVAYVVVGVVLVAYPEVSYVSLCYIAAAAVMLIGLVDVIRYILRGISEGKLNNYLSRGLVLVMVSVFMFVREDYVIIVLPVLLGLSIVVERPCPWPSARC